MKALKKLPDHLKFEESTLRAAASVLFRRLIGDGMKPEEAASLICDQLKQHFGRGSHASNGHRR
ncbi:MAG: hypothetical protein EBV59_04915, partial [Synechococcaceae bacterium WB7_1C_051]|nr:hypothetical protein [Synechococcaceae bacterium WB7_1C_051]